VVRLKAPRSGITGWNDVVKGRIDVPNEQQQDVVIVRNDGMPLYNFGAVVDDITMGITLVARGDDHVVNTPGADPPLRGARRGRPQVRPTSP
jgi:glutamyl-tRNA synthetase